MTKYLIVFLCFFYVQKVEAQHDDKSLSNQFVFDFGAGVSKSYRTDLMSNKEGTGVQYTPIAQMFVKKYFKKLWMLNIPLYLGVGAMKHLKNDPSKPVLLHAQLGYKYKFITPFVSYVTQKAGTTDYTNHPDNKSYFGYGAEFNIPINKNGVLYGTFSKNDRHIVATISMGFVF